MLSSQGWWLLNHQADTGIWKKCTEQILSDTLKENFVRKLLKVSNSKVATWYITRTRLVWAIPIHCKSWHHQCLGFILLPSGAQPPGTKRWCRHYCSSRVSYNEGYASSALFCSGKLHLKCCHHKCQPFYFEGMALRSPSILVFSWRNL